MGIKKCSKCGVVKPFSEFHRAGNVKDGRRSNCKECRKKDYQGSERAIRRAKKWNKSHPERRREHRRRWRERNQEHLRRYNRKHGYKFVKRWRKNNPDKWSAQQNRRRAREVNADGDYTAEEFRQLCEQYGNRCLRCRKKKRLTADHVIPLSKGGSNDISNIQPLCRSCNSAKRDKTTDYRTKPGILRWIQGRLF